MLRSLGRFAECLGKRELRFKRTCWQVGCAMKLPGIRDPFVDQDQAWPVLVEQFLKRVAGIGGAFIIFLDKLVRFLTAKLPRDLTPKGANHRAVRLLVRVPG